MFAPEYIHEMSQKAARVAARRKQIPFVVTEQDVAQLRARPTNFPFPDIGDYRPAGWTLTRTLFCDSSGLGADDEPALTPRRLAQTLKVGMGYAIIQVGQFQVYLGEFEPPKRTK